MIVTLDEIKSYMRFDDDYGEEDAKADDLYSYIKVAEEILENETGKCFNSNSELAKLYIKMHVADMFDNRGLNESYSEKVRFALDKIVAQLSLSSRY